MAEIGFILSALLMAAALFVLSTGVLGSWRFRYCLNRLHAASVNDTLGLLLAMASLSVAVGPSFTTLKFLLIVILLWIASPLSSHLIAQLEISTAPDLSAHMKKETLPADPQEKEGR